VEIRALITDVVMPGINGVQLAELLCEIIPDLRVLFVSGHSNEAISGETLRATCALYLQKPYRSQALIGKLGEALAAAPRPQREATTAKADSTQSRTFDAANPWMEAGELLSVEA
jgi:FixJ family two-component response regulator